MNILPCLTGRHTAKCCSLGRTVRLAAHVGPSRQVAMGICLPCVLIAGYRVLFFLPCVSLKYVVCSCFAVCLVYICRELLICRGLGSPAHGIVCYAVRRPTAPEWPTATPDFPVVNVVFGSDLHLPRHCCNSDYLYYATYIFFSFVRLEEMCAS
jgi:hypothetical protein